MKIQDRVATELESRTVDKIIKTDKQSQEELFESLFTDDFYTDDFYQGLKDKLEAENEEIDREETDSKNESVDSEEVETQAATLENEDTDSGLPFKEPDDKKININEIPKVNAQIVKADELKPELVEFVANAVVEKIHDDKKVQIIDIIQGKVITQEEWYKLILWKYFPVIGIPIYLMLILLLSFNKNNKYDPTLVNFARAEIKTFWIYALVHVIVVFTCCAAVVSFVNIIQRGLMS